MVAVSPTLVDAASDQRPIHVIPRVLRAAVRWVRCFTGRLPGEFTVAKLDAFDQFRRHTSLWRVITILLLTPMTCVLANLLIESIPLTDPAMGLYGSITFLIRNFLTATIVTMVPFFIKPDCIPQLPIQSWKLSIGFGLLLGTVSTCTIAVLIVITGVFPVPSSQFSPMIPMGIVGRLIEARILHNPELKPRLDKIDLWLGMVVAPILIYPIFTAFFMALKSSHQLWFFLLLPFIKLVLRYLLWMVARDNLDLVGSITCTIGHFYHVLFTAMCLQNAKSLEALAAVMAVNFVQMLVNCREILRDAARIRTAKAQISKAARDDVISTALVVAQQEQVSKYLHRKRPSRFFSEYPRYQGVEFIGRHHELMTCIFSATDAREQSRNSKHRSSSGCNPAIAQIFPVPEAPTSRSSTTRTRSRQAYESQSDKIRRDETFALSVASMLHQTEIILLRSYITMFVVSFYGFYLIVVYWLENRQYFATMAAMTSFRTVSSMAGHLFLLCGIEIVFFYIYLVLIQRFVGISGLYQLAFVLHTQQVLVQGKFIMLSIMILGFPLEHYGNGFIFRLHTGS